MRIEQIDAYVVKLPRPNIAENIPDYVRPRKSLSYDTTPPIDDMAAISNCPTARDWALKSTKKN